MFDYIYMLWAGEMKMFIENDTKYESALDYAKKNEELIWHGEPDNLKAMNNIYLIFACSDGSITGFVENYSCTFDSVDEAKKAAQTHYEKYDWSGARLI